MWLEYFNSGGTMVYQSPHVLLAAYAPSERYSTTAAYTSGGEYVRRRVVFAREWAASGSYQDTVFNYIKLERGPVATAYTADGALTPLQASVTTNASAIASLEGASAIWEVVAAASGGTPARIGLKNGVGGPEAWIDASNIFLGDNTLFEDPYNSFYTEASSKRFRFGGPFPASGNMVMWFGPTSVALNSETRTNGYFAFGTDGLVYYGSAVLGGPPPTVSRTNGFIKIKIGTGTNTTDSVTFTGAGGSGSGYTFAHELITTSTTGPSPTISFATGSPITVSATGGVVGDEVRAIVVTTVTDGAGAKAQLISPVALLWES